jgi:cell division control protein 6
MFDRDQSSEIIVDSSPFSLDSRPAKPVAREDEVDVIADAVRPLTRRTTPTNLLVHGPAGTGKTTCVEYVFDKLDDETRVKTVFLNCWQYNSRSTLLSELLIQMGYPVPRRGRSVDELLSKLREWLEKNRSVALALDEVDRLDDLTEIVYDLHLLNKEVEQKIGVVMLSNEEPAELEMDARSRSRLNCRMLEFEPYEAEQLQSILQHRVEHGCKPGTVPDSVIDAIVNRVSASSHDCRQAISMLRQAARRAEQRGLTEIDRSCLPEE